MGSALSSLQLNESVDDFLTKKKGKGVIISSVENMEQHEFSALLGGVTRGRNTVWHCLLTWNVHVTCDPVQILNLSS